MDQSGLLAHLVAGRKTCTENVPTTSEKCGVVVDTAYSANVQDVVLCLRAPADVENSP
jgi:hypothetical protein